MFHTHGSAQQSFNLVLQPLGLGLESTSLLVLWWKVHLSNSLRRHILLLASLRHTFALRESNEDGLGLRGSGARIVFEVI